MKITLSEYKDEVKVYKTREEWDAQPYSIKSYDLRWFDANKDASSFARRTMFTSNNLMVCRHEPKQYPVLAVRNMVRDTVYGPVIIDYTFIYKFTIEE